LDLEDYQALEDVRLERLRQNKLWASNFNDHPHVGGYTKMDQVPDVVWINVLAEEFGEAAKACNEGDQNEMYEELTHTAAVAVAHMTQMRLRGFRPKPKP
jgi:hypothetical protein